MKPNLSPILLPAFCLLVFLLPAQSCEKPAEARDVTAEVPDALIEFIQTGAGAAARPGFLKYAYGNLAEGLYNLSLRDPDLKAGLSPLIDKLTRDYLAHAPKETDHLKTLGDHGAYLANLNLILGVHRHITGRDDYAALNRRVTLHLAERSGRPPYHFPSFPKSSLRWPADQALVLYSIRLFDENFGTAYAPVLVERWTDFLDSRGTDRKTGLPVSEITGKAAYSRMPRGCATSFLILYAAKLDPDRAARWFTAYKKYFLKDYVVAAGFRETADEKFTADDDSGPIIDGVGSAATAFGIPK